jgi:hypothetical protein
VRCRIVRDLVEDSPVCVTVFAADSEHSSFLLNAHNAGKMVTLIVRVVAKAEEGSWRGFLIFEENPVPRLWMYFVEDIVASSAPPSYGSVKKT